MLAPLLLAATVTIPVAGVISNATTAYHTTIRLTNRTSAAQTVRASWIARDGAGSRENALALDLAANETRIIQSTFDVAGFPPHLGAVRFTADGAIEASAMINAVRLADLARLTQDVPGVPGTEMRGSGESLVFYPVIVPGFMPPNAFFVEFKFPERAGIPPNPREETVTVAARGMVQRPLLISGSPIDATQAIVTIRRLSSSSGTWTAYVSNIDGATGDAMMVPPLPREGRIPSIE